MYGQNNSESPEKKEIKNFNLLGHSMGGMIVQEMAKTWFVEKEKVKYFYLCEKAGNQTSIKAADNGLVAMRNWDGVNNLQNIKNETLIIWGDQDKAYNFNQIETLNDNIPNSNLEIIKGCSHNVHLEKPDEFNIIVEKFLKKN